MRRTVLAVITVIGAAAIAGASVQAHHSYGDFLRDQEVTVHGELDQILYASPHVLLRVRADDSHTYTVEWASPNQLTRQGVTSRTLTQGDRVTITGSPMRDPERRTLSLLKEIHRPADGWRWTRGQPRVVE